MLLTNRKKIRALLFAAASIILSHAARAQSGDVSYPTPVFTNEVNGRVAPRDIGDARRTSHFYTFRGAEGDLTVTLDSSDLAGDVDVYTATTLRPLLKITLLGDAAHVTKGFYIRSEETLVLRVEARAVGDAEGSYRITFGGSFKPAPPELANAEAPPTPTVKESDTRGRGVRRVTSTGARVEEPAAATPKEEAKEEAEPQPKPTPAAEAPARETPARRTTSSATRRGAGARTAPRRTRPAATATKPATNTTGSESAQAKSDESKPAPTSTEPPPETKTEPSTSVAAGTKSSPAPRRRGTRATRRGAAARGAEAARTESGGAQPDANPPAASKPSESAPAQRLIILTKDGGMIERDMNSVRRVTVENSQVVVVTKDGHVIREPLANVLKMSIEP